MRESSLDFCPVPKEQQPLNEYEELKESWFFRWATLEPVAYWKKLAWISFFGLFLVTPIAAASFSPQKAPFKLILSNLLGISFFSGLILLRLYLGWMYICDRLQSEKVFYEESGWYDGQIWTKTPEVLARDRLIVSYQIKPILSRLKRTYLILGTIIGSSCLLWLFV
jgi:Conserved in the green lineage and diatoms 27